MQHVITLSIDLEDDVVRRNVEAQLLKSLTDDLKKEIEKDLPKRFDSQVDWRRFAYKLMEEMLADEKVKKDIISEAAQILADKVGRTKAWREKYKNVAELP